ncbi:MAG: hypothetical protein ACRDNF_20950, partial [Streptosporangiaceae bacterium]
NHLAGFLLTSLLLDLLKASAPARIAAQGHGRSVWPPGGSAFPPRPRPAVTDRDRVSRGRIRTDR